MQYHALLLKRSNGGISKVPTNSRSMLALVAIISCSETNSGETSNSNMLSAGCCLPPLPPYSRRAIHCELSLSPAADSFSSCRSFPLLTCMVLQLRMFAGCCQNQPASGDVLWILNRKACRLPKDLSAVDIIMDGSRDEVSLNEFKLFYGIDRELYVILVRDLSRNPSECLQIMGVWLWFERGGFCNFISKILSLAPFLINELADEALICLKLINNQFPFSSEAAEIPLTRSLVKTDIPMWYFYESGHAVYHSIQRLISDVYIPVLSDIMESARHGGFGENSTLSQMMMQGDATSGSSARNPSSDESLAQNFSNLSIGRDASASPGRARGNETPTPRYARTMFATFSKGYPVTEREVRRFFTRRFGNCIDSLHMQEVMPNEQALYAKIVFLNPSIIETILNGGTKAKFAISGKHVWMRQFVPRNGRLLPCGCPSVGPSVCPHHP